VRLTDRLGDAATVLGVTGQEDAREIKAAYRRLVALHPPDRDEPGFMRARAAYEALSDPGAGARDALLRPIPGVPVPRPLPVEVCARGHAAIAVLRRIVADLDTSAWSDASARQVVAQPVPDA